MCVPCKANRATAWVAEGPWDPPCSGGVQESRCPDSESHLCDGQVTTRFPLPNERECKSPIIVHIMRRSLKEGLEFGKAKWECSLASILHWEASLFSYVIMVVVLALEV